MTTMTTITTTASDHLDAELEERLDRLRPWLANVPPHARTQGAARLDSLAILLGQLVADDGAQHPATT